MATWPIATYKLYVFFSDIPYHQFPNPEKNPEGFKAWVNIVGGNVKTASDIKVYRKKVICDIHFTHKFKNRNNRLNALAVPTLHLHGKIIIPYYLLY